MKIDEERLVAEYLNPNTTEQRKNEIYAGLSQSWKRKLRYEAPTNHWNDPTPGVQGNR